jgi:hypothetical protein
MMGENGQQEWPWKAEKTLFKRYLNTGQGVFKHQRFGLLIVAQQIPFIICVFAFSRKFMIIFSRVSI